MPRSVRPPPPPQVGGRNQIGIEAKESDAARARLKRALTLPAEDPLPETTGTKAHSQTVKATAGAAS
ncbi:hypothetical protein GCM10022207_77830 [Streptomyces lannensis]|uniref:Uncharacterized protein n=1 Tax=Streptomyces lannensis TaxID=766498 RepID=A0ABP7LED9_9ACTN